MGFGHRFARALIGLALALCVWPATAQTPPPAASLDPMFVRIIAARTVALEATFDLAERELGFGLVVGVDRDGRAIAATARHVVANDMGAALASLTARFEPASRLPATSATLAPAMPDQGEDFAFVVLDQPRMAFGALPLMPAAPAPKLTPVGYLGAGQEWAPSLMNWRIDAEQDLAGPSQVRISGSSVGKGSSGAPLLGPGVVLGLVSTTRSDGFDAVRIERIKEFFEANLAPAGARWLLTKAAPTVATGKFTLTRTDKLGGAMRLIPLTPTPPVAIASGEAFFAPAGGYTLQAGEPDNAGGLSGLSCFPASIEIRAFQDLAQAVGCERDLAGRWKSAAPNGYVFTFRKTGMKAYAIAMTDAGGASKGSASATISGNDTVTLSGFEAGSGAFSATLQWRNIGMLEGQAQVGVQQWPLALVRQ